MLLLTFFWSSFSYRLLGCTCCQGSQLRVLERKWEFRRSITDILNRWCIINEVVIWNKIFYSIDFNFIIVIFTSMTSVMWKALRSLQLSVFMDITFPYQRTQYPRYVLKVTLICLNFTVFPSTSLFCCIQQTHIDREPIFLCFINNTHGLEVTLCISDTGSEHVASETGDNQCFSYWIRVHLNILLCISLQPNYWHTGNRC